MSCCFRYYFILLLIIFLSCVVLLITYVIFFPSVIPLSLRISHLFVFVVVFLLVPFFLVFLFSFSPSPRARLKWKRWNKNKCLILFAAGGSLHKCFFSQNHCFWFVDFFCLQDMFLFDVLGICFKGVKDFHFLLFCCFQVWT